MTAFWFTLFCLIFVIVAGATRRSAGRAITDATVLAFILALVAVVNMVLGGFVDTGDTAWTLAALIAFAFAVDALYGLLAPQRKRRRDRALRELMQRRRA